MPALGIRVDLVRHQLDAVDPGALEHRLDQLAKTGRDHHDPPAALPGELDQLPKARTDARMRVDPFDHLPEGSAHGLELAA